VGRAKADLDRLLAGVDVVTPEAFENILAASGLSRSYLRKKLVERSQPMDPLVEGVRQDNIENLERTLGALAERYERHAQPARECVLEARRHLDFALRRDPENAWRRTALLHIRTWLENPPIYRAWIALQKQKPPGEPSGLA
jgi:hypothetical protein